MQYDTEPIEEEARGGAPASPMARLELRNLIQNQLRKRRAVARLYLCWRAVARKARGATTL